MKVRSKINWYFIVLIIVLAFLNSYFGYVLFKLLQKSDEVYFEVYILPIALISIIFPLLILIIRSLKTVYIDDEKIFVKHLFGKDYILNNSELLEYYERSDRDKFGKYRTFYFRTKSNTFKIASREFKNYEEIIQSIIPKSRPSQINIYFELKAFILFFLITIGILIVTVWKFN